MLKNICMLSLIFMFVTFLSCDETLNPPVTPIDDKHPKILWKKLIDASHYIGSILPAIYEDKIIVSNSKLGFGDTIVCFDSTGKDVWKWSNPLPNTGYSDWGYVLFNGNFIHTSLPKAITSAVNISTGKTTWEKADMISIAPAILGNNLIQSKYIGNEEKLCSFDFFDISKEYILPKSKYKNYKGTLGWVTSNIEGGDTILYYSVGFANNDFDNFARSVICFNLTKKVTVYDTLVAEYQKEIPANDYNSLTIFENRLYCLGGNGNVFCLNPIDLSVYWKTDLSNFSKGFGIPKFKFADNKIFLIDDEATYVHCLDMATGSPLWKTKSSGNCTKLNYYKGQIIYASGGDGKIHCLDANTGAYRWKLESPDFKNDSGLFFDRGCTIDEKTGRLYATNYRYLLCYQVP